MRATAGQRIRVPVGFGYALLYLVVSEPGIKSLLVGMLPLSAGLALRIWAAGHIDKGRRMTSHGPYHWSRNPLYLGSFLIGLSFTLASAKIWLVPIFCVLFFSVYAPVMRREEAELEEAFGTEYQSYREQVPFFIPLPGSHFAMEKTGSGGPGNFEWRRVILNREYEAVGGSVILTALTILKMLWI